MIRKHMFAVLMIVVTSFLSYNAFSQEGTELSFPISSIDEIITRSGLRIDEQISSDGNGSLVIDTSEPVTINLFEIDDLNLGNKRLTYEAYIRSENLKESENARGISYLELIAHFADGEELVSHGPRVPISGTTDWRPADTVLYIDKAAAPDRVNLNLVVEGNGTVWLDDVKFEALPLRLNYLFWGHIVVWLVLIIYIYDLVRKSTRLKKELQTV